MKAARVLMIAVAFALASVAATSAMAKSKSTTSGKVEYLKSAASPPAQTKARATSPRDPATGQGHRQALPQTLR